jgi:hypothetical protein
MEETMATEKKNYKPKVDPEINQEIHLKLLKDNPHIGESTNGKYFLYSVSDLNNGGEEKSFFAPDYIHELIQSSKLTKGSEFKLKKIAQSGNGNGKQTTRLELALIPSSGSNGNGQHPPEMEDNLKELLLQSVKDASYVVTNSGIQFSNDELQKFATTIFISRVKKLSGACC